MTNEMNDALSRANTLREEEKFSESIAAYTSCLQEISNDDTEALVHCLDGQALNYKILASQSPKPVYHQLALAYTKIAMDLVENNSATPPVAISLANMNYADALLVSGETAESLPYFEKALSTSVAEVPEKGRIKAHIGAVKFLLGQKDEGVSIIKEGLRDIRTGDLSAYHIRVWETGCLINLAKAEAILGRWPEAESLINEAEMIIQDHSLSIRQKEAKIVKEKINNHQTNFTL